ncbi:hypothetical protein BGZ51_007777 [Haplosporangium sp. Z 767]|nr:hypothetical protein BGZ50_008034 [Haplosporangium sp. Z 11]KAF9191068.1 hypothetical protein BGZ51_007777 [Haplosporangium sp. Z 767]
MVSLFQALTVLDYLLHVGSENVVKYARENLYIVKTLKEFQYIDEEGKDQGSNVRQKAKDITALLSDESRLKEERRSRNAMRDRMSGRTDNESHTPTYERPGVGDDDRDLQRALEESRRMAQNESSSRNSEDDDLQKALELSRKEELDRQRTVEKYNELSLTEDWEADSKPVNQYEQQNNTDFFGNDFGGLNNNNNNFDAFSSINGLNNDNNAFLQQQSTGLNNPYFQFQQQQLQQQQLQQQQLMQQQMMQQQLQQQQQMAFMNTMNNPYQQQMMPQMTGTPNIGSNNPFSTFAQKPAITGQPSNLSGVNGFNPSNGFNSGASNGLNRSLSNGANNNSNNNPLGELAFLQNSMSAGMSPISQPAAIKPNNPNDEKYAHLATALSNREDGMDTFGNTGQLRIPAFGLGGVRTNSTGGGGLNPFQTMGANKNTNSLIDIGDSSSSNTLGRSNSTNPFQMASSTPQTGGFNSLLSPQNAQTNSGFLSSQATGYGAMNGTFYNQFSTGPNNTNTGAYSSNTLF